METYIYCNGRYGGVKFLPYLWGMETICFACDFYLRFLVLTVPMRNGNVACTAKANDMTQCSYRTYEEWKLSHLAKSSSTSSVLTVPMRNGNSHISNNQPANFLFLPYLWGMETRVFVPVYDFILWFLPYLWGMETSLPAIAIVTILSKFLPYLWGMETALSLSLPLWCDRSYRTYEEWKLRRNKNLLYILSVLTVPMRNGNTSLQSAHSRVAFVLTVPMRNGNIITEETSKP